MGVPPCTFNMKHLFAVVLCAAASASPLPFNIRDLLQGPALHLARAQGRAEHLTEDSYRAPEAGYGVPEASYGAPESQCVCEQEPEKKKKKGEKQGVFGIFDAIGKLFKKKKKSLRILMELLKLPMEFPKTPTESLNILMG